MMLLYDVTLFRMPGSTYSQETIDHDKAVARRNKFNLKIIKREKEREKRRQRERERETDRQRNRVNKCLKQIKLPISL